MQHRCPRGSVHDCNTAHASIGHSRHCSTVALVAGSVARWQHSTCLDRPQPPCITVALVGRLHDCNTAHASIGHDTLCGNVSHIALVRIPVIMITTTYATFARSLFATCAHAPRRTKSRRLRSETALNARYAIRTALHLHVSTPRANLAPPAPARAHVSPR
jgi:hypothetical protein